MKPAFLRGFVNSDREPGTLPRVSPCFGVYHQDMTSGTGFSSVRNF